MGAAPLIHRAQVQLAAGVTLFLSELLLPWIAGALASSCEGTGLA